MKEKHSEIYMYKLIKKEKQPSLFIEITQEDFLKKETNFKKTKSS